MRGHASIAESVETLKHVDYFNCTVDSPDGQDVKFHLMEEDTPVEIKAKKGKFKRDGTMYDSDDGDILKPAKAPPPKKIHMTKKRFCQQNHNKNVEHFK